MCGSNMFPITSTKIIFNRIAKLIQDIAEAMVHINTSINGGNFLNKVPTG
jgi:hypothetical protein